MTEIAAGPRWMALTWKVRTTVGRILSADAVECSGGALVLSRVVNGELVPFMMISPGGWIEATCDQYPAG